MNFFLSYVILAQIFSIAALSTNLLVGIIGIFSVSQAAIMGVGAYTVALLTLANIANFWVALAAGIALCSVLNMVLALPSLRVAGDYFVVTSFGSQLVATAIFINWSTLTGGASGLFGIPSPELFGFAADDSRRFIVLSTAVLVVACTGFWLLMRSPFGRIVNAIRQDELAVLAAGKDVLRAKLSVSAVSGAYAGAAGGLYAVYLSFIDPTSFDISVSILILTMLVVGGARTLAGSIIGPFLLLALPQALNLIDIPSTVVGPIRQLIYGVLLVAFMLFRPQGIAGRENLMPDYLKVEGVSKRYGGLQALDKCSFTIRRNQTTCLVGPNGAGKTTIFNVITGFTPPDEGTIAYNGRTIDGLPPRAIIRGGIARTFQNLRLFDEMTALDNVMVYLGDDEAVGPFAALARPFHTQAALKRKKERGMRLLEDVGLAHKAHDVPRNLSYGQQKLLCIARVLATGADLLLLDEPTSGLSQSALSGMVDMVHKLREQGHTLLVVEHNTRIVQRIANDILFLHQGRLVAQGPPDAILKDPKLAEIYFGGVV